jgi:hypothetical protein
VKKFEKLQFVSGLSRSHVVVLDSRTGNQLLNPKKSEEMMRDAQSDTSNEPHCESEIYEIRVQGHLQDRWAEWFEGLTISRESDGTTTLYGPIVDQTALQSILLKIGRLNLTLISANRIELNTNGDP